MASDGLLSRLALGAAAGLAGTVVLHSLRTASGKWAPSTLAPVRRDPGDYMVDRLEQQPVGVEEGPPRPLLVVVQPAGYLTHDRDGTAIAGNG